MKWKISLLFLFLIFSNVVWAEDKPFKILTSAKSLKCFLSVGTFCRWKDGHAKAEIAKETMELIFDSIDVSKGKARMIGNQGATDVFVSATPSGITFIEQTGQGNINFTTVFFEKVDEYSNEFKVVHSRHIWLLNGALPSQYYGNCRVWE